VARKNKGSGNGSGVLRFVLTVLVLAIVMLGTLGFLYLYMERVLRENVRDGFSASDLRAPLDEKMPYMTEDMPLFINAGPPPSYSCRVSWPVNGSDGRLDGYPGVGAILNLSLENQGPSDLFVERASLITGWGESREWTVGKYVGPGERRWLRHLVIPIPNPSPPEAEWNYRVSLGVLVEGSSSWTRVEKVDFDWSELDVLPLGGELRPLNVRKNWRAYFDSMVPKVKDDMDDLREVLNGTHLNESSYTIQDLSDVHDWVLSRIDYRSDRDGRDEWLSPMECLNRGEGDCEDFAILYGSIITLMGGSARVIVTRDHAFSAIYIGQDGSLLSSLTGRYDIIVPFQVLKDDLGMWLLIEPQSFLIMGWFPLGIVPVQGEIGGQTIYGSDGISWNYINDDPVYVVDIYIQ
jgi:hypothetical protein